MNCDEVIAHEYELQLIKCKTEIEKLCRQVTRTVRILHQTDGRADRRTGADGLGTCRFWLLSSASILAVPLFIWHTKLLHTRNSRASIQ